MHQSIQQQIYALQNQLRQIESIATQMQHSERRNEQQLASLAQAEGHAQNQLRQLQTMCSQVTQHLQALANQAQQMTSTAYQIGSQFRPETYSTPTTYATPFSGSQWGQPMNLPGTQSSFAPGTGTTMGTMGSTGVMGSTGAMGSMGTQGYSPATAPISSTMPAQTTPSFGQTTTANLPGSSDLFAAGQTSMTQSINQNKPTR